MNYESGLVAREVARDNALGTIQSDLYVVSNNMDSVKKSLEFKKRNKLIKLDMSVTSKWQSSDSEDGKPGKFDKFDPFLNESNNKIDSARELEEEKVEEKHVSGKKSKVIDTPPIKIKEQKKRNKYHIKTFS